MLLCSCGRNLPDSEQVIKRYLKEKYNQEFQIVHTERKNIGQNFGEFINTGEAVSLNESDDAFSFMIKNSIFRNSLIFQGLPPIKYQNLMYFPLFLPL